MAMNVLMVGMSRTWAEVLDNADERYHLYVVEEPDPWNNRKLGEVKLSNIREVQLEEYQQSDAALPVIAKFAEEVGADVVVPGLEYTVLTATTAAAMLGIAESRRGCCQGFNEQAFYARQVCKSRHTDTAHSTCKQCGGRRVVFRRTVGP